ncbi:MAG: hypothetical protein U0838_06285 [Chloroflexota bacterium]
MTGDSGDSPGASAEERQRRLVEQSVREMAPPAPDPEAWVGESRSSLAAIRSPNERRAEQRPLRLAFRHAAAPLASRGWTLRTSQAEWRSRAGNWACIRIDDGGGPTPRLRVTVRVWSGRLAALLDQRDPDVAPWRTRVSAHLSPVNAEVILAKREPDELTATLEVPQLPPNPAAEYEVGPTSAGPWFHDLLGRMANACETWTASDGAIRDALAECSPPSDWLALRLAAILSQAMGDTLRTAELSGRAAEVWSAFSVVGHSDPDRAHWDRTRDILMWSHERFARYLARDLPLWVAQLG